MHARQGTLDSYAYFRYWLGYIIVCIHAFTVICKWCEHMLKLSLILVNI